jgi:hypothetical protein
VSAQGHDPRSEAGPYSSEKTRYWRGRLRERLSFARDRDFLELAWLVDRQSAGVGKRRAGFDIQFYSADWSPGSLTHIGPWEIEALLLEHFITVPSDQARKTLNTHAWGSLAGLVNRLRFIENEQSKRRDPELILEELGRIAYREFGYQATVPDMLTAIRWWSICEDEVLRAHLETTYRLDYNLVLRTFFGVIGYLDGDPFRLPPPSVEASVGSRFGVDRVFALLSRTVLQHRSLGNDAIFDDIAYRESSLRLFPIVKFDHSGGASSYCAPLRHPLWWRLTSGLYYDFVDIPDFQNRIGRQFEHYICNLVAGTTAWSMLPKTDYQLIGSGKAETPDCIGIDERGQVCIIVECKAVKSILAAQIQLVSEARIDRAVAQLAKGIVQVAKYRAFLRQEARPLSDQCANLVVTLDDWMFIGDALTNRVLAQARELAQKEGLPPDIVDTGRIVLTSSRQLEEVLTHYTGDELLKAAEAATGPLRGHELRSIPRSLGLTPKPRNAYIEREFERLVDRPGFGSWARGEQGAVAP